MWNGEDIHLCVHKTMCVCTTVRVNMQRCSIPVSVSAAQPQAHVKSFLVAALPLCTLVPVAVVAYPKMPKLGYLPVACGSWIAWPSPCGGFSLAPLELLPLRMQKSMPHLDRCKFNLIFTDFMDVQCLSLIVSSRFWAALSYEATSWCSE